MSGERPVPTTITYLRMTARPSHPPPSPMLRTAIMRAENSTTHFYRYLYNTIGHDYLWVDRRKWTDEKLAAYLADAGVELYVLYVSGTPAGMAELDFREPDACTLAYFGLVPEFIGRRLGLWFLYQGIELAWQKPIGKLEVNTNTLDHPRALSTYQRMGFEPYAREDRNIMVPDNFA